METDITLTKFYKSILLHLLNLHHKLVPFESNSSKAASSLEVARRRYIDAYIINEIIASVLSSEPDNSYGTKDRSQAKVVEDLRKVLTLISLDSYLHPFHNTSNQDHESENEENDRQKPLTLLNVNGATLSKDIKDILTLKHREILKEKISEWLLSQCNTIIAFTFTNEIFSRASKGLTSVLDHVTGLKSATIENRMAIEKQKKYNNSLLKLVNQQLSEYGIVLESLVQNYRMSAHPLPHLTMNLFSMDVYLMKFRCMELKVLTSTYTPPSVACLKKINNDLDSEHGRLNGALMQVEQKLLAYRDINPRFHQLLKEYARLQKDLKVLKEK